MQHRAFLDVFYTHAITGRELTSASLAPLGNDPNPFEHIQLFEKGFPGYAIKVDDFIEAGDKVVVRARLRGRHTGNFNGIPATGRRVEFSFIMIYRLEGGKIVQHWLEANHVTLLAQLGVMTAEVLHA
jgi:ketosteroid isomerase-like protein